MEKFSDTSGFKRTLENSNMKDMKRRKLKRNANKKETYV